MNSLGKNGEGFYLFLLLYRLSGNTDKEESWTHSFEDKEQLIRRSIC